jgi:hypothetical protein
MAGHAVAGDLRRRCCDDKCSTLRIAPARPEPGEKGDPPALAERFTFHDLRAKSASDDELEVATERLADGDPRTTQQVYRRKPRRARPGAKILDASGDIGPCGR